MNTPELNEKYWENRYLSNDTGWDIGSISTPLKEYIDQLSNKKLKVLIPGCGRGYEAEYLFQKGFRDVYPADIAVSAKIDFLKRVPGFPEKNWINNDFFSISAKFDLVIEQTFFCALNPELREKYTRKMAELLNPGGKLVGLLFTEVPNPVGPPFGGSENEYRKLFSTDFEIIKMEPAYNSIPQRAGRELFFILKKKSDSHTDSVSVKV